MESDNVPKNSSSPAPELDVLPKYTIPGILHFIQHEWTRFEMDRAHWEVERAELQAKIAFLQGERKGQENLKHDLIRRIKMLEYALKQERAKYHKLKFGTELNQEDLKPPQFKDPSGNENADSQQNNKTGINWRQGRQLLRQYLQEIGYTDAILDVRSSRVRSLLGLTDQNNKMAVGEVPRANHVNETEQLVSHKYAPTETATSAKDDNIVVKSHEKEEISNFDFIEHVAQDEHRHGEEDDGEDDGNAGHGEEDEGMMVVMQMMNQMIVMNISMKEDQRNLSMMSLKKLSLEIQMDQALAEFDFLDEENKLNISDDDSTCKEQDRHDENADSTNNEWGVDSAKLAKLKEQYKKDVKRKKNQKRPGRGALQEMIANLNGEDDAIHSSSLGIIGPLPIKMSGGRAVAEVPPLGNVTIERNLTSSQNGVNETMPDKNDVQPDDGLVLGDLAGITVSNEADPLSHDVSSKEDARQTWNLKFTLRSHFDTVRAVCFHPREPSILTGSEDHTVKLWNMNKTTPTRKGNAVEIEPIHSFRGHSGAILSVEINSSGEICFTASADGTIRCWNLPSLEVDPYDPFDASTIGSTLTGHTNAVWDLAIHHQQNHLLSCSADGTCRLWNPIVKVPIVNTYSASKEQGIPTSVDFVRNEANQFIMATTKSMCSIIDTETGAELVAFDSNKTYDNTPATQINRVISHPTMGMTITAHEDRYIKFFDNNTGKQIHSMVAHLDAVTSLAVDSPGLYLLSGSHDCSIRLWNLETRTCVQEITSHRKKFDESIYDVAFHPRKAYIASAGADGLAKVFL
ncbi:LOW QUALITY PROTEIN: striatin-like [Xenia sp. Carnegie-2017]|uniref:LOW QUALITY PROTEIN: striatin-like n=1 Tax=Xenia sp. Carnegie-2017 TaxID=2897299 RepID=UPI001F0330FA|nr:LOW QUALITY PROTEIN: striatin-like [Xenia sp. Carnegie-2017]